MYRQKISSDEWNEKIDWPQWMKFHISFQELQISEKKEENIDIVKLYNDFNSLPLTHTYKRFDNDFDMSEFCCKALQYLNRKSTIETQKELKILYLQKHRIRKKLWKIFGNSTSTKKRTNNHKFTLELSIGKNGLGLYKGYIHYRSLLFSHKKIGFINDNLAEFLVDIFYTIECLSSSEEYNKSPYPKTFSSYWLIDFDIFCNRHNPEGSLRTHVESEYYNQAYDRLSRMFHPDKISDCYIHDLLYHAKEDPYYIMEVLLKDPDHFSFDESNNVIHNPLGDNSMLILKGG